jgi:hypothetical protein
LGTAFVDTGSPVGPRDLGSLRPDGSPEQLAPFFAPSTNQVAVPSGLISNSSPFPVVVDNYPDALPILYFRRTPGIETPAVAATRDPNVGKLGAYVMEENKDILTSKTLKAVGGRTIAQAQIGTDAYSMWSTMDKPAADDFQAKVLNGATQARGGFILISAGLDRIYGTPKLAGSGGSIGTFDDIVVVGGD